MRALPLLVFLAIGLAARADYLPQPGAFPPASESGHYLSGELVYVDGVNRRGAIRLDGGPETANFETRPLHYFALLPYGMIRYHGAPAALRDVPLGTHLHCCFFVPPVGEEGTIPQLPTDVRKFEIAHNHALRLEDDFSFYGRHSRTWKVKKLNLELGKLSVTPVGDAKTGAIDEPRTFDFTPAARIWQGRSLVDRQAVKPGTVVQFNLSWAPGTANGEFSVVELWLDAAARKDATKRQRATHIEFQRVRWLAGWIDTVEPFDYGGGIVTLTLFGGLDKALYDELKAASDRRVGVACADKTLRTWRHRTDRRFGKLVEWRVIDNPQPGSSGIQLVLKFAELLQGFGPGEIVRVKSDDWKFITVPPEEMINSREERQRAAVMRLPGLGISAEKGGTP